MVGGRGGGGVLLRLINPDPVYDKQSYSTLKNFKFLPSPSPQELYFSFKSVPFGLFF